MSHLSILTVSLGLFCCYILMGFGSVSLSRCISGTVQMAKKKSRKNGHSQFREKKKEPHTQGKKITRRQHKDALTFSRVPPPAASRADISSFLNKQAQSSRAQSRDPLKHWGEGQGRGCGMAAGGKTAGGIGGVQPQSVENVPLPGTQKAGLY